MTTIKTSHAASTTNGKHMRSHSLKSLPEVQAVVITDKKKQSTYATGDTQNVLTTAKITSTWKQACDRTRDRTKQLLRRTMSWKSNTNSIPQPEVQITEDEECVNSALEVYIRATWVKRCSGKTNEKKTDYLVELSSIQEEKFIHFFKYYLDGDCDGFVFEHDFHQLFEKLRRFADWSPQCHEYIISKQVLEELVRVFFPCKEGQNVAFISLSMDDWLKTWQHYLNGCSTISNLPLWLKYLMNILFKSLDSGNGVIKRENLQRFYCTFLDSNCEESKEPMIDNVYKFLTSNGDFLLDYEVWSLCFANWLLGTKPNGSGQWLFGRCGLTSDFFPIDYSAMNSTKEMRDTYSLKRRSHRYSVIV
ncbi:uncharacterized protein LOC126906657 [Daktulosphaira vitifoliae]|uniref:uncharacterized protein LOC126906657 n=1 Tax=Daktulosphaira vitifoliae TaxID=58002 RepID=UPI0021AA4A0A|nr:uncharacterized protein LOC126906657 [Daktulosphaira vitifoliae]